MKTYTCGICYANVLNVSRIDHLIWYNLTKTVPTMGDHLKKRKEMIHQV